MNRVPRLRSGCLLLPSRSPGAREEAAASNQDLIRLLELGSLSRATGSTAVNAHSSRSHAIFTIVIEQSIAADAAAQETAAGAAAGLTPRGRLMQQLQQRGGSGGSGGTAAGTDGYSRWAEKNDWCGHPGRQLVVGLPPAPPPLPPWLHPASFLQSGLHAHHVLCDAMLCGAATALGLWSIAAPSSIWSTWLAVNAPRGLASSELG